jgi:hypothetical protein
VRTTTWRHAVALSRSRSRRSSSSLVKESTMREP